MKERRRTFFIGYDRYHDVVVRADFLNVEGCHGDIVEFVVHDGDRVEHRLSIHVDVLLMLLKVLEKHYEFSFSFLSDMDRPECKARVRKVLGDDLALSLSNVFEGFPPGAVGELVKRSNGRCDVKIEKEPYLIPLSVFREFEGEMGEVMILTGSQE